MVVGIDKFRNYFAGHESKYAIVGGTACDLLFDQAGLEFRATKDIDMVLCIEVADAAFIKTFMTFLDDGGYQARERSSGKKEFYRFHRPKVGWPHMIEIFSRRPETLDPTFTASLAPIPHDEETISLSAILLDDNYYSALQNAKHNVDGITIIDETLLIPLKAHAYINLVECRERGEGVKDNDIKKHLNDVFRLAQLLAADADIAISKPIQDDLSEFLSQAEKIETLNPEDFGVNLTRDEGIALLRSAYRLA